MSEKNYSEVSVARIYEKVVEQIEKRILNGDLKPGDRLPAERELGMQFGVSRTSIREAMRVLTLKGLVQVNHGRGTFVTEPTSRVVRNSIDLMVNIARAEGSGNLIELREILEPEIAALAAQRANHESLTAMREAVVAMDEAMNKPDSDDDYIEADLDFHLSVAEAAGNPLFLVLIDLLVVQLRKQRLRAASKEGVLYRGQAYHRQILEAVENGESETARKAMRAHMKEIRADIR